MSELKKSIVIDSQSLLGGGSTSGSKRKSRRTGERKIRPSSIVQPSTLKKTLLERIKQHQRIRERSRENTDVITSGSGSGSDANTSDSLTGKNDNFTQSMNFLRELALKRRTTQRRSSSLVPHKNEADAKTPEAQILREVGETLHNGEIITNTGLLGLPVVPTLSTQIPTVTTTTVESHIPVITAPMTFTIPTTDTPTNASSITYPTPKITELSDLYNNTIASVDTVSTNEITSANVETPIEPPLHIPSKPEDFLPSIFLKEDPPHGCLKGGRKPTFREWVGKILKGGETPGVPAGVPTPYDESANAGSVSGSDVNPNSVTGMRVKIRKTKKKSYRLGKHDNVVGVLLKNKQTQRHIQSQHLSLRQKTIGEIRKYLYDHHLLKIGSNAPPDVLRRMYEDAILTGDVKNTNDGVLLHNFIAGGGGMS